MYDHDQTLQQLEAAYDARCEGIQAACAVRNASDAMQEKMLKDELKRYNDARKGAVKVRDYIKSGS